MTVNELLLKIDLPKAISHFGVEMPRLVRKLPMYGWYAVSKTGDATFNCIDLFKYNMPGMAKLDDDTLMHECYRYYTYIHKDLLSTPIRYSETVENSIARDYLLHATTEKFYNACRAEALEGSILDNGKSVKFTKFLADQGMPQFINSGVGLIGRHILRYKELKVLCLGNKIGNDAFLFPTFFAPNNKLATLETGMLGDLSKRSVIYLNREPGWYGRLGPNLVGGLKDLMTVTGCSWSPKILDWMESRPISLHHSLQPSQCVEIWANKGNLVTDKDPISLIGENKLLDHIQDSVGGLTLTQIKQLETITGLPLKDHWMSLKTSEVNVGNLRFISNNGVYYYLHSGIPIQYANFNVELSGVKKEDGEFYQYGTVIMDGECTPFKIRRKCFASQQRFLEALDDVTLEAGLGTPHVAPNLKHYITDVIHAFNPINPVEKPKPAVLDDL
jgi:hypothetical protein